MYVAEKLRSALPSFLCTCACASCDVCQFAQVTLWTLPLLIPVGLCCSPWRLPLAERRRGVRGSAAQECGPLSPHFCACACACCDACVCRSEALDLTFADPGRPLMM